MITIHQSRDGVWLEADHELLWSGPATGPSGGFADRVYLDFERRQLRAEVKLAKHVETDDGYSGLVFKYVFDELPLTDENLARYRLKLIVDSNNPVGVEWVNEWARPEW